MWASGKWIRTLVGRKPAAEKEKPGGGRARKWSRLWQSSSCGQRGTAAGKPSASEVSETSSLAADALSSVVAAVVRAPPRDFRLIRQEWAAVRIQTAFRAFLARRALRALRGSLRLQALVRGRRVRKQMAVTLKCWHLVLVKSSKGNDNSNTNRSKVQIPSVADPNPKLMDVNENPVYLLLNPAINHSQKDLPVTIYESGRQVLLDAARKVGIEGAEELLQDPSKGVDEVKEELNKYSSGISGVPHFVINGKYQLSGGQPPNTFMRAFEAAAKDGDE